MRDVLLLGYRPEGLWEDTSHPSSPARLGGQGESETRGTPSLGMGRRVCSPTRRSGGQPGQRAGEGTGTPPALEESRVEPMFPTWGCRTQA